MVTRPSAASTFSASRRGVRLMPNSSAIFSSSIQLPGSSSRRKMRWRNCSATCSYRARGVREMADMVREM